ncbi:MAG: YggT family protein [Pseudomonadales bacterium]|jgi:YggT family protein|nr:YggT family protein [Pseudomonadales bacterium]
MNQAISGAGLFLVQAVITLATFAFLLRFILQAVRADFYNPITQAIVRITDPVLKPARKVIPPIAGLDVASLLLTLLLQFALVFILFSGVSPLTAAVLASFRLLTLVLNIYFWALIIIVVISWIAPGSRHPGADLLHQLTEPLLAPFRRLIPPVGGLDFSIMVVFLVLVMIREYLLPGIAFELGIGRAALG